MNTLTFDIETVPDVDTGRRLHDFQGVSDKDVATAMVHLHSQETGREILPHYLHKIVAISVVLAETDGIRLWSLGKTDSHEQDLIRRFFSGIGELAPVLVSWNGGGFDLPVLHYRALLHGIIAPRYWETGETDHSFRYNSYLGRFHWRHIDLMDVLSGYQLRAAAPLDGVARMLGLPGKSGMRGSDVWSAYQRRDIAGIRNYCETDALVTYLVYLRFQLMRGKLAAGEYGQSCRQVRELLAASEAEHLQRFYSQWDPAEPVDSDVS